VLSAVCCLLSAVCCLLEWCVLFAVCWNAVCYLLCAVGCLLAGSAGAWPVATRDWKDPAVVLRCPDSGFAAYQKAVSAASVAGSTAEKRALYFVPLHFQAAVDVSSRSCWGGGRVEKAAGWQAATVGEENALRHSFQLMMDGDTHWSTPLFVDTLHSVEVRLPSRSASASASARGGGDLELQVQSKTLGSTKYVLVSPVAGVPNIKVCYPHCCRC
jgi:hypothetical protein